MSKYDALTRYLLASRERDQGVVEMDFADIDGLVGGLPASAREHRPWWGNGGHVQALGWQKAGFRVDQVYLDRGRVRFMLEQADATISSSVRTDFDSTSRPVSSSTATPVRLRSPQARSRLR